MNTIQMRYKADTGNSPILVLDSNWLVDVIDDDNLKRKSASEIRIELQSQEPIWAIDIEDLPIEYNSGDNESRIPTPEYVQWLEEKVIELQKLIK